MTTTASPSALVDRLRQHAAEQPDRTACIFLPDRGGEQRVSYGELDLRARAIAATLTDRGAAGARAFLLYRPGIDYITAFLGCLYAGVVAIPAYPPDLARLQSSLPRLLAIMSNARPLLALTTTEIAGLARGLFQSMPALAELPLLATDSTDPAAAARYRAPASSPDLPAFLQYTSGSTGDPKGVALTQANLVANLEMIQQTFRMHSGDRVVSWLPPYHDMGLIGTILEPLYVGAQTILMSPMSFLRQPRRWLDAVTKYRATVTGGPNFGYGLCARKISAEQRDDIDLSSLEVAFVGAEPIRSETMTGFAQAFSACGFRRDSLLPCYGLAEATLLVSGAARAPEAPRGGGLRTVDIDTASYERGLVQVVDGADQAAATQSLVGAGFVAAALDVRIVDPDTRMAAPAGTVGEIWVRGDSVSTGYWELPETNRATFGAQLADASPGPGYLRTGDLGFLHDGELFVSGRRKDLIIVNGRNLYPQDIEAAVEGSHEDVRPGSSVAFARDAGEGEQVVVVAEVAAPNSGDTGELAGVIRRAVAAAHGIMVSDVVLVARGTVPKTTSGKVRRRASRAAYLAGALPRIDTTAPVRRAREAA